MKIILAIINFFKKIFMQKKETPEIKPELNVEIKKPDPDKPIKKKKKKPKRKEYALNMTEYVEKNGTIYRRYPKIRMSKKQRIKQRWEGRIRFENQKVI